MKNTKLAIFLLIVGLILLATNLIFLSDKMDFGFWMRILSNMLVIATMIAIIRERKKNQANS